MREPQSSQTKVKLKRFNTTWWLGIVDPVSKELKVYTRNDESSQISLVQVLIADSKVRDGVAQVTESALGIFLSAVQRTFPGIETVTTKLTELAPGDIVSGLEEYSEVS